MKRSPTARRKWMFSIGRRPQWQSYIIAIAATVATLFIRKGLGVAFGERPLLILFMFPAILSASLGGLGPGLLSTILSTIIVAFFLIPPTGSFAIAQAHDTVQLFMLFTNGVLVSFLSEALHRSRVSAENRMEALDRANVRLEEEISDRKGAEEALRRERALLRCLIDSPSDLIFIKDREGVYLGCNRASEDFIGMPESEQIGKTDFDFFDRERAEAIRDFDRQVLAEGKPHRVEEWVTNRNGVRVPMDTLKAPYYSPDGKVIGLVGICRDVTERKNLETQLRQSQKMEAIGTLAGGVAHEFNNIMTAVIGYGSLLKFKLANDPALLSKVEALLKTAERAAVLVRSLLSFSRRQGCEMRSIDLNELISREGNLLQGLIREDIDLNLSLAGRMLTVKADSSQIEQVLVNLINNSRDAMPRGGKITISTALAQLDEQFRQTHGFGEPGEYAVITLSDNGEGMAEEVSQKIFEPFFTTREVGKGTGLGLSICYGIIKQHKGYIVCDSGPGQGTTFSIYLPTSAAQEASCESEAGEPLVEGTETILIAEDNEDVREVAREVLEEYGYKVIEAADGNDALGKYIKGRDEIALLIIDVIMPGMNGRELFMEISRLDPGKKVIFYSGHTADVLPDHVTGLNGLPYLSKPFVPDQLLRMVREVLDGKG